MADLLSEITSAAKAYYAQASKLQLTAQDFYAWLASLSTERRAAVLKRGFNDQRTEPTLLRYCLEARGCSMWRFMREQLSAEAFALWADQL
ncbi:hypothetical protein MON38_20455 [Hymenobacter sp. DH14]|uniref:Uncharacterized protein n=1 Tax=Hymenobacter cyanobacteriorum TaxID=2926463 RepID=A0A9X2AH09_9BACT|nr:hypothetical protein [Hymenobacter cyanobacteriorum]MCI1189801.1 hypothetical protein [Hymenobacter cyanobacteriorum]